VTQIAHVEHSEKFQKQQAADVATLGERCEELNAQITGYSLEFDVERVHELAVEMRRLWKSLKELQAFIELLNVRQALFELPLIESTEVQTMTENFRPYHDLWTTGSDSIKARELWCGNPMFSINLTTISTTLNDHKAKLTALLDTFAEMSEVLAVNQTFLDRLRECEPLIAILAALKNPDWTHPHWSELAQRSEMPIKYSESINLQYLIDYGIAKHKDLVEEISAQATEQKEELEALAREAAEVERLLMIEKDRKRQRRLLRTDI
jgi:dynein heavy chain, axonemal